MNSQTFSVLVLSACIFACMHGSQRQTVVDDRVAIRLTMAHGIQKVTIHSDGRLIHEFPDPDPESGDRLHLGRRIRASGKLAPGELNDILLALKDADFWAWEPGCSEHSADVLDVESGGSRHRVCSDMLAPEDAARFDSVASHVISFATKNAANKTLQPRLSDKSVSRRK